LTAVGPLATDMYLLAFDAIEADFGTAPGTAQLTLSAWFAGLCVGQMTQGTLSDRFGRRRPLIVGTLKGTFYAMLFAAPIALLGAVYTSEFMHPRFKLWVKPTIEVMASLPSVVLGFLAALWLAPLLEEKVPSVLACIIGLPTSAILFGFIWSRQPDAIRSRIRPGYEFLAFAPVMFLALWVSWNLGGPIERLCFGGDFRSWWPQATGASYENGAA
jgi:phosphate transport system permease protein